MGEIVVIKIQCVELKFKSLGHPGLIFSTVHSFFFTLWVPLFYFFLLFYCFECNDVLCFSLTVLHKISSVIIILEVLE